MTKKQPQDIRFSIDDNEKRLIEWVAKKQGYRIGLRNNSDRGAFIRKIVLPYCESYYRKYKEAKEADARNQKEIVE